ncbi:dihydroorotase [Alkaliphilus peptidifermentans]|uniref:Dihydroorotase n=1 Tax=Alkaliphilus peptidifermentans DSM 18978 TaxID=1120976 RepID=A0A1G5GI28_9FIRM|nr:dihydroorotase [Alkaliphilus peptidifermentans]SCY51226.1 dihydroorotase [Alkaliphilus peptidifermentans DSM 18978]
MKLLIKNGHILDPATNTDIHGDVLVIEGKIADIQQEILVRADEEIDAAGCWVVPGLIDVHVHLREPGFEHKENILTGSRSAAMGGFTTICCMPNTNPVIDSVKVVDYIQEKSREADLVRVLPIGSITLGQQGKELVPLKEIKRAGICGISEDGKTVMNIELMERAMELAAELNVTIFSHCEDHKIAGDGVMNQGKLNNILNLKGIPNEAEDLITERDILLAKKTGAKLHLCHVSTKDSVHLVREAKLRGVKVTAEVSPHHFTLTEEAVEDKNPNTKMNPPLRSSEDVAELIKGLKDGTIEIIATDHAPHHEDEKAVGFEKAPFGIVGLETAVALGLTELVDKGILTPTQLIEKMSTNPAKLLGIEGGSLKIGDRADITIINPNEEYEINKNSFVSKSKNTPFHGRPVKGKVIHTIVEGKIVVQNGKLKAVES